MKKKYIIPQACVFDIIAHIILAGSGEPENDGQGTTGIHTDSKESIFGLDVEEELM